MRASSAAVLTREQKYLAEDEFKTVFGVTKDAFQKLPLWKQSSMKKDKKLF